MLPTSLQLSNIFKSLNIVYEAPFKTLDSDGESIETGQVKANNLLVHFQLFFADSISYISSF